DPPASSQEAWAWLRSWTRTSTPDACTAGNQIRVRKVSREIGVPSRMANSRSFGPRRRPVIQSASCAGGGGDPALDLGREDLAHRSAFEGGVEVLVEVGPVGGEGGGLDLFGAQPDGRHTRRR